jgi:hypothetical protein
MSWVGYNTDRTNIKTLLQQEIDWTDISWPIAIADVEKFNKQIYSEIRVALKKEDISLTITDEDELELLALINDLGTSALIEKVKYEKVPQTDADSATIGMPDDSFQKRYENKLKDFVAMKKLERDRNFNSYSGFGVHSSVKASKPFFKQDDTW